MNIIGIFILFAHCSDRVDRNNSVIMICVIVMIVYYSIWVNISVEIVPGSVIPTRSLVNRTWAGTCRILACTRAAFIAGDFRRPLETFGVPSPSSTLALVFCVVWLTRCVRPCGLEHAVTWREDRAGLHLRCHPAPPASCPLTAPSMRGVKGGTPVACLICVIVIMIILQRSNRSSVRVMVRCESFVLWVVG